MIVFIPRTWPRGKCNLQEPDWEWLPSRCPGCGEPAVVGHGRRRKQAHDRVHDWIPVRRCICKRCHRPITVLPAWSLPYTHYSLQARQEALRELDRGKRWEEAAPRAKDPDRIADPATLRRWVERRLRSLGFAAGLFWKWVPRLDARNTILAWDWRVTGRILPLEAHPP